MPNKISILNLLRTLAGLGLVLACFVQFNYLKDVQRDSYLLYQLERMSQKTKFAVMYRVDRNGRGSSWVGKSDSDPNKIFDSILLNMFFSITPTDVTFSSNEEQLPMAIDIVNQLSLREVGLHYTDIRREEDFLYQIDIKRLYLYGGSYDVAVLEKMSIAMPDVSIVAFDIRGPEWTPGSPPKIIWKSSVK